MHKFKTCGLQNFCKVICNYLPKKTFFSEPFQTIYRTIRCSSSNKIAQKLFVPDTCRPDIRRCIAPPVFHPETACTLQSGFGGFLAAPVTFNSFLTEIAIVS